MENTEKAIDTQPQERLDRRLIGVRILRKLCGFCLLLTIAVSVWQYREDINMVNFYRIASYFGSMTDMAEGFKGYNFEVGIDSVHDSFSSGIAVLNRDTFKIINAAGNEDLSVQLKYKNPKMSLSDKRVLTYDLGGKNYSIFGSYSQLGAQTMGSPILYTTINDNGDYLIITDEIDYRGGVYIYNSSLKEQYKWATSEYYVILGAINKKASNFSVMCMKETDSGTQTIINSFSVNEEAPVFQKDITGKILYSMEYDSADNLVLICSDGMTAYDRQGTEVYSVQYSTGELVGFSQQVCENPIIALKSTNGWDVSKIDNAGKKTDTFSGSGNLRSLSYAGKISVALVGDGFFVHDIVSGDISTNMAYGAKKATARVDGSVMVTYADKVEIFTDMGQ